MEIKRWSPINFHKDCHEYATDYKKENKTLQDNNAIHFICLLNSIDFAIGQSETLLEAIGVHVDPCPRKEHGGGKSFPFSIGSSGQ